MSDELQEPIDPTPEPTAREQLEMRVLSVLLGEADGDEEAAVGELLSQDPELQGYQDQMQETLGLTGEAAQSYWPPGEDGMPRLSGERRKELTKLWDEPAAEPGNGEEAPKKDNVIRPNFKDRVHPMLPVGLAASLAILLGGLWFPKFLKQQEEGRVAMSAQMPAVQDESGSMALGKGKDEAAGGEAPSESVEDAFLVAPPGGVTSKQLKAGGRLANQFDQTLQAQSNHLDDLKALADGIVATGVGETQIPPGIPPVSEPNPVPPPAANAAPPQPETSPAPLDSPVATSTLPRMRTEIQDRQPPARSTPRPTVATEAPTTPAPPSIPTPAKPRIAPQTLEPQAPGPTDKTAPPPAPFASGSAAQPSSPSMDPVELKPPSKDDSELAQTFKFKEGNDRDGSGQNRVWEDEPNSAQNFSFGLQAGLAPPKIKPGAKEGSIEKTLEEAKPDEQLALNDPAGPRRVSELKEKVAKLDKSRDIAPSLTGEKDEVEEEGSSNKLDLATPVPIQLPEPKPEVTTADNPFSTFSLNVTDASFRLCQASLQNGQLPPPHIIRTEEFINTFDYRDPAPSNGKALAFAWDRARHPFAHNRDLLRFSIQTAAEGRQGGQPLNLVLAIDNSGSMERADRVAILKEALKVLSTQLHPLDKVSVIAFARTPRLWMDGETGEAAFKKLAGYDGLVPEGGTNIEAALALAYETAGKHFIQKGNNRVILLTDGAANLGEVIPDSLRRRVESQRKQGIALDCFGVGWDGYNDHLMEALARNGDGRYAFLNSPADVERDFAKKLAGALKLAAADVKVQVEFNPMRVKTHRQVGYLRHQLKKEDFRNNSVDAAEIGAAESGNAIYVVQTDPRGTGPIGRVHVRYREPATGQFRETSWALPYRKDTPALEQAPPAMKLAATAATFAEWLGRTPYAGDVELHKLQQWLTGLEKEFPAHSPVRELQQMVRIATTMEK